MSIGKTPLERAMALAAVSGLKATLGPAFLAASRRSPNARTWTMAALGEMFLDKTGIMPPRYRPSLLIPHAIAGGWVARESMRQEGAEDPTAPLLGAVVAAGIACVAPVARITLHKGLGISDVLLGVAEDYVAIRLGTEATGMTMEEVAQVAQDAFRELRGRLMQSLPSASTSSSRAVQPAAR